MKKICITAQGNNLEAEIDPRFGRCAYLLFIDEKGKLLESLKNPNAALGGAGIATAQLIIDKKADTVITQNIGPNAVDVLKTSAIDVLEASGSIKNVIEDLKKKKLNKLGQATRPGVCFGMGRGMGRGQGRRRGCGNRGGMG